MYRGGYYGPEPRAFHFPTVGRTVKWLIGITVGVFLVQVFYAASTGRSLSLYLGVVPGAVVERLWVWQVFTYMFLHSPRHLFHIIMNMLLLYWFGTELERLYGRRRFLTLYLGGGIAGGLAYAATQYLARTALPAIGASAAVMAVMVVYAIHFPNRIILLFFLIPMPVKWFVVMVIGIDLVYSLTTYADGIAHTAHLGGALFGYVFWRFGPALERFLDGLEDRRRERQVRRRARDQERLDEILAKISREGFDSLSRREREFLKSQSAERRGRG